MRLEGTSWILTVDLQNMISYFCILQDESLRVKKKEREDLGVELYGVQQELARYQVGFVRLEYKLTVFYFQNFARTSS